MFLSKRFTFWILTIATINMLIVSQLLQDGMFMDGMLYTSVAKNLSEGIGTFWNPRFSETTMISFHEQPPLYFGLLAIFYKLFGTSMYVERFFVFTFFVLTLVYICKFWKKLFIENEEIAGHTWLPVLFYSTTPVCFWAYTNHVEEVVMCAFVLMAVYHIYVALFSNKRVIFNLILGGIFIFLASLTKGPQGLFPIACVAFYWLITKNISFKKMVIYSLVLVGIPALIYGALILIDYNIYVSFQQYFSNRFIKTFNNVYATTNNRLEIFVRLFTELLPIISITFLIKFFSRKQDLKAQQSLENKEKLWWLLAVGLSGSLPLAITTEQRGFYLVTALPYFALVVSAWLAPTLTALLAKSNSNKIGYKIFSYSVVVALVVSVIFCFSQIGKFKRDKELLTDIYTIGAIIPRGETVGLPNTTWNNWSIQTYFMRYCSVSLDEGSQRRHYFITEKNHPESLVPSGYRLYPTKTNELNLYILK